MNPSSVQRLDTHRLLVEAFFGAQKFDEVIAHAHEVLSSRPDEGRVLSRLGIALVAIMLYRPAGLWPSAVRKRELETGTTK